MNTKAAIGFLITLAVAVALLSPARAQKKSTPPLIVDVHLHAETLRDFVGRIVDGKFTPLKVCADPSVFYPAWDPQKPLNLEDAQRCARPVESPVTEEELLQGTLQMLERYNIRAVTSGDPEVVAKWRAAAPDRIIPAHNFEQGHDLRGNPIYRKPAELRRMFNDGRLAVLAEVAPQYHGVSPADPALEPYFALAEELDIPIGLHMGEGPVGGPHVRGYSQYRVRAGNPLLLEDVLIRHPKLRIYVMHFGSPMLDEMVALLYSHPQVYVDIAQNNWGFPRKEFHRHLRRLVEAGFGQRILFGSDQMIWPETIRVAIESVESADFLTESQKRDIFCRNAARFFRWDLKNCEQ